MADVYVLDLPGASRRVPSRRARAKAKPKKPRPAASAADALPPASDAAPPDLAAEILYPLCERQETKLLESLAITVKNQMLMYEACPELQTQGASPLLWWRSHAAQMPHLAVIARDLLGIPGASHALERAFSHAGQAVDPRKLRWLFMEAYFRKTSHE